jgi:hypothetical protein
MKKIIYLGMAAVLILGGCAENKGQDEGSGSIHGTVTDKAGGEPVQSANVQLRPSGKTTLTGSDGYYEIQDVPAGDYNLKVTKTGYSDLIDDYVITVSGKAVKRDAQIEKLPSSLRTVNDKSQDIDTLDFGSAISSLQFGIFNNTPESFDWTITEDCEWITVSPMNGKSATGVTTPVTVVIDRDKLSDGVNTNTIHISSVSNGSKTLTIIAAGNGLPVLITNEMTNLTSNSATFNGEITYSGKPAYTERGFAYSSASSLPTTENSITPVVANVTANPIFSANVINLAANTTYYVRAYAKSSLGTAYGNVVSFNAGVSQTAVITNGVTDITATTAKFNATITDMGSPVYTERGFCYNKTGSPTIANNKRSVTGTGDGNFSTTVEGLDYQATYYVRAYAIQNGAAVYGDAVNFSTTWTQTELVASAVTNLGATSVTLNATINNIGDPAYTERGFCYNKTGNPTTSDTKKTVTGSATGNYSYDLTNLDYQTTYYVKAYAIQNGTPVYSNSINFTTTWTDAEVRTIVPANIGATTATLKGSIINAGDPAYSERGFCYNKTGNPTISNKTTVAGTGIGDYSLNISDLDLQTTYYVRAYVLQNGTPLYGVVESFTTIWVTTDISTYATTNIEANSATLNGMISNMGQPECSEHGFVYSTTRTTPTVGDTKVTLTGYATSYSANVTGLSSNQTYYVRAYALQTGDPNPIYGAVMQFTTGTPPTVQTLSISGVTKVEYINGTWSLWADLNGNVTNAGNPAYVERGFVYKEEDVLYNTPPTYEQDRVVTVPTTGTGNYTTSTLQLDHMSWYVVRAYVKTASGAVYYGGQVTFDTWNYTTY